MFVRVRAEATVMYHSRGHCFPADVAPLAAALRNFAVSQQCRISRPSEALLDIPPDDHLRCGGFCTLL